MNPPGPHEPRWPPGENIMRPHCSAANESPGRGQSNPTSPFRRPQVQIPENKSPFPAAPSSSRMTSPVYYRSRMPVDQLQPTSNQQQTFTRQRLTHTYRAQQSDFVGADPQPVPRAGSVCALVPQVHAAQMSDEHSRWSEFSIEGGIIGVNDPVFDFFDCGDNSVPVTSDGMHSHTTREVHDYTVGCPLDSEAEPSFAAPTAQVQYVPIGNNHTLETELRLPDEPRGRIVFRKHAGEQTCGYVNNAGKCCDRKGPKLEVLNGTEGWCVRCSKHFESWKRSNALPPTFAFIPKTVDQAKNDIFSNHPPVARDILHEDTSLEFEKGQHDKWQKRFLEAVMELYQGDNKKLQDQQRTFKGEFEINKDGYYDDGIVNSRLALLYHIAWNVHTGGPRIYPVNGDNGGYPREGKRLTFVQRLELMESLLKENKRIAMDIINGRGVVAFVENPDAFERRKATNNANNETKKKRKRTDDDDAESQNEGDEAVEMPTSVKRKRAHPGTALPAMMDGLRGLEKAQHIPTSTELLQVNLSTRDTPASRPLSKDSSTPGLRQRENATASHASLAGQNVLPVLGAEEPNEPFEGTAWLDLSPTSFQREMDELFRAECGSAPAPFQSPQ